MTIFYGYTVYRIFNRKPNNVKLVVYPIISPLPLSPYGWWLDVLSDVQKIKDHFPPAGGTFKARGLELLPCLSGNRETHLDLLDRFIGISLGYHWDNNWDENWDVPSGVIKRGNDKFLVCRLIFPLKTSIWCGEFPASHVWLPKDRYHCHYNCKTITRFLQILL